MARLTAAQRKALPDSAFLGPNRTYPAPDRSHAANAKARASQFASPSLKKRIDMKARKKYPGLGNSAGAKYKGKRKPSEVSDVRSQNPGTKGVESEKPYRSKGGYQIPYSQDTNRNPYKR